jgi:hypothetical protein
VLDGIERHKHSTTDTDDLEFAAPYGCVQREPMNAYEIRGFRYRERSP